MSSKPSSSDETARSKPPSGGQLQTVFYPACDLARLFASIANTTTLTDRALRQIEDHGFKVEIERPTTKTWR